MQHYFIVVDDILSITDYIDSNYKNIKKISKNDDKRIKQSIAKSVKPLILLAKIKSR